MEKSLLSDHTLKVFCVRSRTLVTVREHNTGNRTRKIRTCSNPEVQIFCPLNTVFVLMKGFVGGVDEETACSWLTCSKCGSDKLSGGTAQK